MNDTELNNALEQFKQMTSDWTPDQINSLLKRIKKQLPKRQGSLTGIPTKCRDKLGDINNYDNYTEGLLCKELRRHYGFKKSYKMGAFSSKELFARCFYDIFSQICKSRYEKLNNNLITGVDNDYADLIQVINHRYEKFDCIGSPEIKFLGYSIHSRDNIVTVESGDEFSPVWVFIGMGLDEFLNYCSVCEDKNIVDAIRYVISFKSENRK